MTALTKSTIEQNIEEISIELLDSIYYAGYVEQMSQLDSQKIEWEIAEMQRQFSTKK